MLKPAQLRDFAVRYTAAWCSQDPASVAAFFSPDGSLSVNGGTPAVGRSAIAEVAQGFMSAFPDMKVLMDGIEVQGDRAVYRWTLAGTNTGPGGTGQRVRISGFELWRIGDDGLIGDSQGHFDSASYTLQLEHGVEGLTGRDATNAADFYCPACRQAVVEPLVCGDCRALICRQCGTVLEKIDELGIG